MKAKLGICVKIMFLSLMVRDYAVRGDKSYCVRDLSLAYRVPFLARLILISLSTLLHIGLTRKEERIEWKSASLE